MRHHGLLSLCLLIAAMGCAHLAHAQGAASELFGVREVVIDPATFDDPKSTEACNLSREKISSALAFAFKNTSVPATLAAEAKPLSLGVARVQLVPEVYTYANESLDCISWVSLTARNHVNAVIPPVPTLRSVNVVYWQASTRVTSGVSSHDQRVIDVLQKMAAQFAQQYQLAQPPALPQ